MAVIDSSSPAYNQVTSQYYLDELENARILLYEVNNAIQTLVTGNHISYQLDTGQGSQRVTREDLNKLRQMRIDLINQISDLELVTGTRQGTTTVRPAF